MRGSLPVLNQLEATFDCTFGRGCDGLCCQNGRPPIYPEEKERLDANLEKFFARLRPEAQRLVAAKGYLGKRFELGLPMARVAAGWCVFFNRGCVLHTIGAEEGDEFLYKPAACALFPLARDEDDRWYVRQHGYKDEPWDLFCLSPQASPLRAAESLRSEMERARHYDEEAARMREQQPPKVDSPRNPT
jgi:Fe-S-cluster containining protein